MCLLSSRVVVIAISFIGQPLGACIKCGMRYARSTDHPDIAPVPYTERRSNMDVTGFVHISQRPIEEQATVCVGVNMQCVCFWSFLVHEVIINLQYPL